MANTIRLKQGTGSDPSASDLVLGEPAVRTDTGEIFLLKDDGTIAKVAGGIEDGDKGDITVSNDGATFTIDSGVIDNANINTSAAIAYSKLANISANRVLGRTNAGAVEATQVHTGMIADDAVTYAKMGGISNNRLMGRISSGSGNPETLTPANVRTIINVEDGATADQTASEILTLIKTVDGAGSGLDADTLDGATSSFFQNASNLSSGTVPAARLDTATTQSAGNNSTKIATTAYTDTAISNLINGAPAALDTLNELAAAMNDDAAFSATVTNSLATKLPLAGGTLTGNLTISNTSPQLIFVDTNHNSDFTIFGSSGVFTIRDTTNGVNRFELASNGNATFSGSVTATGGFSGSGASLTNVNATTLDSIDSGSFLRSDADDSTSGRLTFNRSADEKLILSNSSNPYITFEEGSTDKAYVQWHSDGYLKLQNAEDSSSLRVKDTLDFSTDDSTWNTVYHAGNLSVGDGGLTQNNFTNTLKSKLDGIESGATADQSASEILTLIKTVDGSGSGLDADTLDGVSSGSFARKDGTNMGATTFRVDDADFVVQDGTDTVSNFIWRDQSANTLYLGTANAVVTARSNIIPSVDSNYNVGTHAARWSNGYFDSIHGEGSNITGVNATTLDSIDSGSFLRSDAADTASSDITFSGGAGAATIAAGSDIRFPVGTWTGDPGATPKIQGHGNALYICGGTSGIRFREDGTDRWHIDGSGHLTPATDSNYNIGSNGTRVSNGYFDTLYGDGSNLTNLPSQTDNNFTTTLKNKLDGIAASATNVTNNNQLTNGAGYTTYTANQAVNTGSQPTFLDVYTNGWFRNNDSGEGLYNQATQQHWYSDSAQYWNMDGDGTYGGIKFRDNHGATIRGYLYYNNSNQIGFLDSDGHWAVQVHTDTSVNFRVNNAVELTVLPDTVRCEGAFFENNQTVAANKTISDGYNAMSAGPITVNNSVTVTVGSGEVWTII